MRNSDHGHSRGVAFAPRRGVGGLARPRLRPGFTLAELMVSVGVLMLLLSMVGWIFSTATRSSLVATANNENMSTFRTAERQFRQDFEGLIRNAFVGVWYQLTDVPDPQNPVPTAIRRIRTDRLVFFTAGDHSSIEQMVRTPPPNGPQMPVRASVARVFYGHENNTGAAAEPQRRILARRAKLQVADVANLPATPANYALPSDGIDTSANRWDGQGDLYDNWEYEFADADQWQQVVYFPPQSYFRTEGGSPALMVQDLSNAPMSWIRRPLIRPSDNSAERAGMQMYFLPGCAEFKVQRWIEHDPLTGQMLPPGQARWFPEEDRDGNGLPNDNAASSDFSRFSPLMGNDANIREYFNGPPPEVDAARSGMNGLTRYYQGTDGNWVYYPEEMVPKAIKITIRLYDPNNRITEGLPLTMVFTLR